MKIYVASSWRNAFQPEVVELLRSLGHEVYDFRNPTEDNHGFAWSDIDEDWQQWTPKAYVQAMKHPIAEEGFKSDFDAMKWADCCVMVLPCGRSANTEAGWMKGAGKPVYVFQPIQQEPELMYKIYDDILTSFDELELQFKTRKFSLEEIEIDGYYFLHHEGLYWHSGEFWHNEEQLKKVNNNGSLSILLHGSKIGVKKLRTQARKCKIKLNKFKCPF